MGFVEYLAENVLWASTCYNNNSYHLLENYYIPSTLPSVLYMLSHLIFITILWDRHYFFSILCMGSCRVRRVINSLSFTKWWNQIWEQVSDLTMNPPKHNTEPLHPRDSHAMMPLPSRWWKDMPSLIRAPGEPWHAHKTKAT
jgi:hypothetical protein